jgi:hypothetical protein
MCVIFRADVQVSFLLANTAFHSCTGISNCSPAHRREADMCSHCTNTQIFVFLSVSLSICLSVRLAVMSGGNPLYCAERPSASWVYRRSPSPLPSSARGSRANLMDDAQESFGRSVNSMNPESHDPSSAHSSRAQLFAKSREAEDSPARVTETRDTSRGRLDATPDRRDMSRGRAPARDSSRGGRDTSQGRDTSRGRQSRYQGDDEGTLGGSPSGRDAAASQGRQVQAQSGSERPLQQEYYRLQGRDSSPMQRDPSRGRQHLTPRAHDSARGAGGRQSPAQGPLDSARFGPGPMLRPPDSARARQTSLSRPRAADSDRGGHGYRLWNEGASHAPDSVRGRYASGDGQDAGDSHAAEPQSQWIPKSKPITYIL